MPRENPTLRLPATLLTCLTLVAAVLAGCGGSGDAGTTTAPAATTAASRQAAAPDPVCSTQTHRNGTRVRTWTVRVVNALPSPVSLRSTNWECGYWWFHHLVPSQFDGVVVPGSGGAVEKVLMKAAVTPGFTLIVSNEAGAEIGRFAVNQTDDKGFREGLVSVGGSPLGMTAVMPGSAASGGVPVEVFSDGGGGLTVYEFCDDLKPGARGCD